MEDVIVFVKFLEGILKALDRVAAQLGPTWPEFRVQLVQLLDNTAQADEDWLEFWVNEVIALGIRSPAASIFREILRQSQSEAIRERVRLQGPQPLSPDSGMGPDAVRQAATALANELQPEEAAKGLPSPRYLNAGFLVGGTLFPTDQPLTLQDGPYQLGVNVGKFWGPGHPDTHFPNHLLEPYFEGRDVLELDVAVRSLDVKIVSDPSTTLHLTRKGDSHMVFFDLQLTRTGRQAIDVDLLFCGHLLQSRRVEVEVIAHTGIELPESAWPVQDGYVTFTRTAMLDPDTLEALEENPRGLTVVAERDLDYNRIGLRFYDATGNDLGFQQSELDTISLTWLLGTVRKQLVTAMHAYGGTIGSDRDVLEKHLGLLAEIGRAFYLALLPGMASQDDIVDEGQRLDVDLAPGDVIQVAPLSPQLGVPWELLYERPAESYQESRTKLCPSFTEHGPDPQECPGHGDPTIVCPHGFWGYRYIIEQLPRRVDPHASLPGSTLPLEIRNELPLRFLAIRYTSFELLNKHWATLRALAPETQLDLVPVDTKDGTRKALVDEENQADVVYFYTHGGIHLGTSFLGVGTGERIKYVDLDAWKIKLYHHQPLVVLNACESAAYSPDRFENLIKFFCDAGAAGVVGTQCEVKELLADAFVRCFFQFFFEQATAGEALFKARRKLLYKHLDPRGLVYSLFATADVKLVQPIKLNPINTEGE